MALLISLRFMSHTVHQMASKRHKFIQTASCAVLFGVMVFTK